METDLLKCSYILYENDASYTSFEGIKCFPHNPKHFACSHVISGITAMNILNSCFNTQHRQRLSSNIRINKQKICKYARDFKDNML